MARTSAIAATTAAILKLLERAAPGTEFTDAKFLQHRSADLQDARSDKSSLSMYLYHVGINASRRTAPDTWGADGRRHSPILPLDLHYLMTAWAKDAATQQRLLGWAMRVVQDTPTLPAGLLNAGDEGDVFGPGETVEVVWETLSPRDLYDIWDVARRHQQLSAAYVARVIEIDSLLETHDAPLVQTRELAFGEVAR